MQGDGLSLAADRIGHAGLYAAVQHIQNGMELVNDLDPAGGAADADHHGGGTDV